MMNPKQAKILIVEDEKEIRELLSTRFRIFGFQTCLAENGEQGWDFVQKDPTITIVVTDLHMPGGSGWDLLDRCKARDPFNPRVFTITGQSQFTAEEALARGAEGFLHKPFDARSLLNTVRNALLTPAERLRYPPYSSPAGSIDVEYESLDQALTQGELALGRGGLFISTDLPLPSADQIVSLDLKLGDLHLEGSGLIRWVRTDGAESKTFAGVEFVHLKNQGAQLWQSHLEKYRYSAYLPSPAIASSMPSQAKLKFTG